MTSFKPLSFLLTFLLALAIAAPVEASSATRCTQATIKALHIDVNANSPYGTVSADTCKIGMHNGFPSSDSTCTPGAYNPSVTLQTLKDPRFRTSCLRNLATSEKAKGATYDTYNVPHPDGAQATRTCELDHLVPLELGGADTLNNIWPQCGRADAGTREIYFHTKDRVELCIANKVKAGTMDLDTVRKGMAADWTQYLKDCGAKVAAHHSRKRRAKS